MTEQFTTQSIGNLHNFILIVKGTPENLNTFEKDFCNCHKTKRTKTTLEIQISINANKLKLTNEYETRQQIIGRIANPIETAIFQCKVNVVSFD